jgi:hypothetical protein
MAQETEEKTCILVLTDLEINCLQVAARKQLEKHRVLLGESEGADIFHEIMIANLQRALAKMEIN